MSHLKTTLAVLVLALQLLLPHPQALAYPGDCWETCDLNQNTLASCAQTCGNETPLANTECWASCGKRGVSDSTCRFYFCGNDQSSAASDCWKSFTASGASLSSCVNHCGSLTGGGSVSCWSATATSKLSLNYRRNLCGSLTHAGAVACYDACQSGTGLSVSYCRNFCGI